MVTMTVEIPDSLAENKRVIATYLPAILQLQTMQLQTSAKEAAREAAEFLFTWPTSEQVLNFFWSGAIDVRLKHLLAENKIRRLTADEDLWLDELEMIGDVVSELKVSLQIAMM